MTPQMTSRRGCRVWFRRVAFALIIGIAVLIAAGFVFETVMESGDTSRYPRLGQLVNVDGQPVHIACVGEGSPAVIFIGGAGALSFQDASLQAQVQPYTHTCI